MAARQVADVARPLERGAADLPLWRLNLMRVGYAVMGVGLAVVRWPDVIGYDQSTPLFEGVVAVLLTAMSLLACAVSRPPVADPVVAGTVDEATWRYVGQRYVTARGDRWRGASA